MTAARATCSAIRNRPVNADGTLRAVQMLRDWYAERDAYFQP
jgi:hypothetical protein